jgi:DNA-binding transcriptional regulator LsrR (DeoR family)
MVYELDRIVLAAQGRVVNTPMRPRCASLPLKYSQLPPIAVLVAHHLPKLDENLGSCTAGYIYGYTVAS